MTSQTQDKFSELWQKSSSIPVSSSSKDKFSELWQKSGKPSIGLGEYIAQRGVKGARKGWQGLLDLISLPASLAAEEEGEKTFNEKMKDPYRYYLAPLLQKASGKIGETLREAEEKEGEYYPESEFGEYAKDILGGGAETAGLFSVPIGGIKSIPAVIGIGAGAGAAGGTAKALGAPEPLQMVTEIAATLPRQTINLVKSLGRPKELLAKGVSLFSPREKSNLNKQLIQEFRNAGIQADIGTITDNRLVKAVQTKLAQSGLTGEALQNFKQKMQEQIVQNYRNLAEQVGTQRFSTSHAAGETTQNYLKKLREADIGQARSLYQQAMKAKPADALIPQHAADRVAGRIQSINRSLAPGALKSIEQQKVTDILEKISGDVQKGNVLVDDLINDKIALNEIIDYETQGGAKQLLKTVVKEIDNAIKEYGRTNPKFMLRQNAANQRFAEHAKTFRNSIINKSLFTENPADILNKMNSIAGIKALEKALSKSPGGEQLIKDLKRFKLEEMIGNSLIDSTSKEVKLGTFSNLFEKGKGKELVRELLGSDYQNFKKLQSLSGKLAESANKFLNTSQTAVNAVDIAFITKSLSDIAMLLVGNPWPLVKTGSLGIATRMLSSLMADPKFLRLVEEAILNRGKPKEFAKSIIKLKPFLLKAIDSDESLQE